VGPRTASRPTVPAVPRAVLSRVAVRLVTEDAVRRMLADVGSDDGR